MCGVLVLLLAVPLLLVLCVCRPRSVVSSSRQGEKEVGGRRDGAAASECSANQGNGMNIELTSLTPTTDISPCGEQDAYIPRPASSTCEETSGLNFRLPS